MHKSLLIFTFFLSAQAFAVSAAEEATFFDMIHRLEERDPERVQSEEDWESYYADRHQDAASWTPSLGVQGIRKWSGSSDERSSQTWTTELQLFASVNVLAFSRDRIRSRLAEVKDENLNLRKESARVDAERRAATMLLAYSSSFQEWTLARKKLKVRAHTLDIARQRFEKGLLSVFDLQKARMDHDLAKLKGDDTELDFLNQQKILSQRLGHEVKAGVYVPFPENDSVSTRTLEDILSKVKEKSLDERISRTVVLEKTLAKEYRQRKFLPSLDLNLTSTASRRDDSSIRYQKSTDAALVLTVPILDRAERSVGVQQSLHEERSAEEQLALTQRQVAESSAELDASLRLLANVLSMKRAILKQSQDIYSASLKRFEQAQLGLNDLVLEQGRVLEAESDLQTSWLKFNQKLVDLCLLKGIRLKSCLADQN